MSSLFGTGLLDRPSKRSTTLIDFYWGDLRLPDSEKNHRRFADVEGVVTALGSKWKSTPSTQIRLPPMTGTLQEEKASVTLPFELDTFTDYVSDGLPFAPTRVKIMELLSGREELILTPGQERPQILTLYAGWVDEVDRNAEGKPGRVRINCLTSKSQLKDTTLGILETNTCGHPFGGTGCYLDLSNQADPTYGRISILDNAYISSAVGSRITIESPNFNSSITNKPATYWDEGYISVEGLRMKIRIWETGTNNFIIYDGGVRESLQGITNLGDLVPGCDKSLTNCRFWNREDFFGGYGYGIPDFNPLFQVPE